MAEKEYVDWQEAEDAAVRIAEAAEMIDDPDHIVGVARGGLPLAVMVSHRLDVPLTTLRASHYDGEDREEEVEIETDGLDKVSEHETVLLVDDVADTGMTLEEITDLWSKYRVYYHTAVWHKKPQSEHRPNIVVDETDKWVVYPWEEPTASTEDDAEQENL